MARDVTRFPWEAIGTSPLRGAVGRLEDLRVDQAAVGGVATYTMSAFVGSTASVDTRSGDRGQAVVDRRPGRPAIRALRDAREARHSDDRASKCRDGAIARAWTCRTGRSVDAAAQCAPASVLLYTGGADGAHHHRIQRGRGKRDRSRVKLIHRPEPRAESLQWAPPSVVFVTTPSHSRMKIVDGAVGSTAISDKATSRAPVGQVRSGLPSVSTTGRCRCGRRRRPLAGADADVATTLTLAAPSGPSVKDIQ